MRRHQDARRLCGADQLNRLAAEIVPQLPTEEGAALNRKELREHLGRPNLTTTYLEKLRFEVAASRIGKLRTTGSQPRRYWFEPRTQS